MIEKFEIKILNILNFLVLTSPFSHIFEIDTAQSKIRSDQIVINKFQKHSHYLKAHDRDAH